MMYVIQVRSGFEESVADLLRKKDLDIYCPIKEMQIRNGGSWHMKRCLVFTQYIFIVCGEVTEEIYYKVKSTFGVIRFLGHGEPKPLRYGEEAYIRWLNNNGKPIEASKVYVTAEGDVMILSGILRNYQSDMINLDLRQRRAKLKIPLHGENHTVTIPVIPI